MTQTPLRMLVVDDTVVYRRILCEVLESLGEDPAQIATAPHGRLALSRMEQNPADLVLLDLEMPELDGLATLARLRRDHPLASVVMISGADGRGAEATVRALEQGALDFLRKPEGSDPEASRAELRDRLRPILRMARTRMNLRGGSAGPAPKAPQEARKPEPTPTATPSQAARPREGAGLPIPRDPAPSPAREIPQAPRPAPPPEVRKPPGPATGRIDLLVIGVSTGGPNALGELIPLLPGDLPVPVLVVQHMPPLFTASLAEHLDRRSALSVREARDGEALLAGSVLLAPGGRHLVVRARAGEEGAEPMRIAGINDGPPENSCRPSVDVLFRSAAAHYAGGILAVVMTGMGSDGCEGVRALRRRGCYCLTQSEESCVVYGMPLSVDEAGLSDESVPLASLAHRITRLIRDSQGAARPYAPGRPEGGGA